MLFLILMLPMETDHHLLVSHVTISLVLGYAGESDRGKRPMMTKIVTDKSDVTILTSGNPKSEDPCMYTLV